MKDNTPPPLFARYIQPDDDGPGFWQTFTSAHLGAELFVPAADQAAMIAELTAALVEAEHALYECWKTEANDDNRIKGYDKKTAIERPDFYDMGDQYGQKRYPTATALRNVRDILVKVVQS